MEHRRRWASSGAMPPALASRFTLAEQAVLSVVAAEVAGAPSGYVPNQLGRSTTATNSRTAARAVVSPSALWPIVTPRSTQGSLA